jgi:hypothetical protein
LVIYFEKQSGKPTGEKGNSDGDLNHDSRRGKTANVFKLYVRSSNLSLGETYERRCIMGAVLYTPQSKGPSYYGSNTEVSEIVSGILGLAGICIGVAAIIFAVLSIYTGIRYLTWPAIVIAFTNIPSLSFGSCLMLLLEGGIAGILIGCIERRYKFKSKTGRGFLSELFSLKIFKTDINFLPTILLGLLVGSVVGFMAGSSGTMGLTELFSEGYSSFAAGIVDSAKPIAEIIIGGGAGGIGGGDGIFGAGFFLAIMIIIIFMVQGIIVGSLTGLTFGVLFGAINGAVKGGTLSTVVNLVAVDDVRPGNIGKIIRQSARKGTIEGALVGGIVGLIQGVIISPIIIFYGRK